MGPQAPPTRGAAASRAEGASPRARVPPVDYADKLPPMPVGQFYAAAPVHDLAAVDTMSGNSTPRATKRTPRFRMTLTTRTVAALEPERKPTLHAARPLRPQVATSS